ncbi:NUC173 domain-containing protein [Suillus discolor]|uniref:NUC173 domain-containing protein n=1 Tax=Suillus discolor TaxID=1912936 RepID=A0A9P7FJ32_9AGAM|nr:NUC173 domain-containing protein [Suillus discolor]KAG2119918.1 NUC173 domain-containing protein [Suillus discolor]
MEEALAKIRPHTTSNLAHQKAPANLLQALESTFQEKHADRTPTAYFAALITTLDGSIQKKETSLGDGDVLPAELYLLALVAPFVPPPVIQTNLNTLLSLTAPLFPALMAHAPPLRSQLTLYNAVFRALDKSQLDVSAVRQSFASILQLCLDPRPKVRKKAADIVKDVLSFPPSPLIRHPYAQRVAEWAHIALQQASTGALPKSKSSGKGSDTSAAETAIHLLAFLRPVLPNLPLEAIPPITTTLLTLPRLGNPYLSQAAYSILSDLFTASTTTGTASAIEQIPAVLHAVLESPPAKADNSISPSWIRVLGDAMFAYHVADASACATEFHRVWKTVWSYFETKNPQTRKAVAESLDLLTRCITSSLVKDSISDGEAGKSPLRSIISQITKALDSLSFASAMQELLSVISALISNLGVRVDPAKSTTATEALLMPLVSKIADLRVQKGFEHKEAADAVLSTAMRVVGPAVLLEAIPLNLEPSDRQAGKEPRAFLLPMLNQPHPSLLGHFVSYFVPMSERMFNLQQKADSEGRQSEAKVWSVLVTQIWSGFAGYCHAPSDIKTALTPAFSQLLSQLLYSQPDLRPPVLRGLKALIESNKVIASQVDTDMGESSGSDNVITPEQASENLTVLKTQVESWFAVFFNVFGSVDRDNRGMVGDVISVWAGLAEKQDIAKAYRKVVDLFRQSLQQSDNGNTTAMMEDLLILLLPFLDTQDVAALFSTCLAQEVLCHKDNGVQKRGYKILAKLLEHGKVEEDALQTFQRLDELSKDRFILLSLLILRVPSESLHIIPSLIPEAVLEKARLAAFELIVAMGQKMSNGGIVKRSMVDGMDEDCINEYMTMVAGGLAGASPHMISATVTAVSRLVFEFRESIDTQMQTEVFTTLLVFLSSANHLVPALLAWSHDHKNHFKAKVRHIFERMIRRFGWNDVYQAAGEDQAAKVLERAKRKKAREDDDEEEGRLTTKGKVSTGDAFEDVLYGSESELDDSDEDEQASRPMAGPKRKGVEQGVRLRVDDDEPMDLLQGVASRLTNAQANRRRKPGQDAGHFKTDTDTGKIVINEDEESDIEVSSRKAAKDVAGSAYRESMTSVDGFTRGPNGRIKFNKDTKKRRRENEDEDGDVEMADGAATTPKKHKRPAEPKFGHEFKAKKAGGDVKKGGVDPYAYVSLSQAAKKKGRNRTGIAGKHR